MRRAVEPVGAIGVRRHNKYISEPDVGYASAS
jgi:hypothetical protein